MNMIFDKNQFTMKLFYNDIEFDSRDFDMLSRSLMLRNFKNRVPVFEKKRFSHIHGDGVKPHPYEDNVFDNSLCAVKMGERLVELIRFYLRNETENYLYRVQPKAKYDGKFICSDKQVENFKNEKNFDDSAPDYQIRTYAAIKESCQNYRKANKYKILIIDNNVLKRDIYGCQIDIEHLYKKRISIKERINKLKSQGEYDKANNLWKDVNRVEKVISDCFLSRVIYQCEFEADDFSFYANNKNDYYAPKLWRIWENFNVNVFNYEYSSNELNYDKIDFQPLDNFNIVKRRLYEAKKGLKKAKQDSDLILIAKYEKDIKKLKNVGFRGLKSIIRHALNDDDFQNVYKEEILYENDFYNNYNTNSSKYEIEKKSILI